MSVCLSANRWIKKVGLLLVFALAVAGSAIAAEQTRSLTALGSAVLLDQNMAAAKQNAIMNARVAAVGQLVTEMLTNETVEHRFQMINEKILDQPDRYVRNYHVLSEATSGQTVRVLVTVDVATEPLSRDLSGLGLAMAGTVYPRILFMLAETNVGDSAPTVWWGNQLRSSRTVSEGAMAAALQADGYEIADLSDLTVPLSMADSLSDSDRLALARRLGADVLMAGTATATPPSDGGSAVTAEVAVRALNVRSGQPMGQSSQRAEASAPDAQQAGREALSNAGSAAADDLGRQILIAWQQDPGHNAIIELMIGGISGQIASFVRLRTALAALPGVKDLKMKEMTGNQAVIAVNYDGTPRSLADALLLKNANGFKVDIEAVTDSAVQLRLVQP